MLSQAPGPTLDPPVDANAARAALAPDRTPDLASDLTLDLTGAERARILAKSALFDPPPALLQDGRRDLVGLSRAELAAAVAGIGEAPFRAKQLWHWIYHRGVTGFRAHVDHRAAAAGEAGGAFRGRAAADGGRAAQC